MTVTLVDYYNASFHAFLILPLPLIDLTDYKRDEQIAKEEVVGYTVIVVKPPHSVQKVSSLADLRHAHYIIVTSISPRN